jgi:uncharacterized tellurite resistance protein B-like protein
VIPRLTALLRGMRDRGGPAATDPERIPLAMAALLIEAARADHQVDVAEVAAVTTQLARHLELSPVEAERLATRAREAVERSVSLHEFTRPLHESLTQNEKLEVVAMLWGVVLADRRVDRYEEYLVGKVAELLYVARGDVIRLRNAAQASHTG